MINYCAAAHAIYRSHVVEVTVLSRAVASKAFCGGVMLTITVNHESGTRAINQGAEECTLTIQSFFPFGVT